MGVTRLSRHRFSTGYVVGDTNLAFLGERAPYAYRDLPDNRQHLVSTGDTIFNLAGRYFAGVPRAAGLWWVIADFQPIPIHDPTIRLVEGTTIVIPSLRTLHGEILNDKRRSTVA
jgi:hypothetical protein